MAGNDFSKDPGGPANAKAKIADPLYSQQPKPERPIEPGDPKTKGRTPLPTDDVTPGGMGVGTVGNSKKSHNIK